MKLFETIEKMNMLSKLIKTRRTGSPEELANRLGISRANLYLLIEDLKYGGVLISYSRTLRSFYFEDEIEFQIQVNVLHYNEFTKISAGSLRNFLPSNFLDGRNISLPPYSNTMLPYRH